ncbi:hypothetical protein C0583_01870 [Candidatus Parcubacteria bacterium]|nr:MAG: hypothetical protein C0583_01870 [Candidatus Parcubacteria bacterium]
MKKEKVTIYFCGNPLMKEDSLPFELVPMLEKHFQEKIKFVHHDPNDNLPVLNRIFILDVVINTIDVITIENEKQLETESIYSAHDWDLAFNLKLLLKMNKLKSFFIIGIPPSGDVDKIKKDVIAIIDKNVLTI